MSRLLRVLAVVVVVPASLWALAALWLDGPPSRVIAGILAAGFAGFAIAAFALLRPFVKALLVWSLGFAAVLFWWLGLEPSNQRDWTPDVANLPSAEFDGDLVTLRNVRSFEYRSETDYTERWTERTIDLSKLVGVDLFLSYWSGPYIAHTIASWEFADDRPLAISIETRKERGEGYSAVLGFFRQFELYYVVADESDPIGLRTNFRGEDVYLYRMVMTAENARALLIDYLEEVNALTVAPRWYNALTHNCTTMIEHHAAHVLPDFRWDWRILVNGLLDQVGYERGTINTSAPFEEIRRRSNIVDEARSSGSAADFSSRIRVDLPDRPGGPRL